MRKQIEEMKGYHLHLVIQKQLKDIDVNKNEGRLCIPFNKMLFDFTNNEEMEFLNQNLQIMNSNSYNNGNNKMEVSIGVKILDEGLRETSIYLKKLMIEKQCFYFLSSSWNSLVDTNSFRSGDIIQLWSFRKEEFIRSHQKFVSLLYLAINKVDPRICL